jgi:hypothetical protein
MEITEEQYSRIKDSLPVQRGNVSLNNLQMLNALPGRKQGASSRNFRNKPASQPEGKFFAGLRSTFGAGRALLSKPPWPETGRTLR